MRAGRPRSKVGGELFAHGIIRREIASGLASLIAQFAVRAMHQQGLDRGWIAALGRNH
jgi:hypothetical protein